MDRAPTYLASIEEVRKWLLVCKLDQFVYLLLDNGYDDLDAVSKANDTELLELENLFAQEESKESIRWLSNVLRSIGIQEYRRKGLPTPPVDLHKPPAPMSAAPLPPSARPPAPSSPPPPPPSSSMPLPPCPPPHAGFLSVRTPITQGDEWIDRHCSWREGTLSWFKSRRDSAPEFSLDALRVTNAQTVGTVFKLVYDKDQVFEFSTEASQDAGAWTPVFDYICAVAHSGGVPHPIPAAFPPEPLSPRSAGLLSPRGKPPPPPPGPRPSGVAPPPPPGPPPHLRAPSVNDDEPSHSRSDSSVSTISTASKKESLEEKRERVYQTLLLEGAVFKKFQHNMGQKRRIWVSENFDRILWGDEEKTEIKGFMKVSELIEINRGHDKNKLRIYLVSMSRTLELEAKDPGSHNEWMSAFRYLLKKQAAADADMTAKQQDMNFVTNVQKFCRHYADILRKGDIFKKYKKGSCQVRHIWFSPSMDRINWGDPESTPANRKPKGEILLEDMVSVKSEADHRFVIWAAGRDLELEARDDSMKKTWMDALQFFIKYGDKLTGFKATF